MIQKFYVYDQISSILVFEHEFSIHIYSKGELLPRCYSFIVKRSFASNFENSPQYELTNDCFCLTYYNVTRHGNV